jgi:16S rRNA (uracil1498-N3)-methyltransferase
MAGRPRRVPIAELTAGPRQLEREVAHYVGHVLRLRPGDFFVAFDPTTGLEAEVVAENVDDAGVFVRVGELRAGRARAAREIVWIQALAKADKCDAIVRDATELGATQIVIATTERSVVRLDGARAEARLARWRRIADEAARQCERSEAPRVEAIVPWEDALVGVGDTAARFCLWEQARDPLGPALDDALAGACPLAFACGPEGGLTEGEASFARGRGWCAVSLGPRILRTETVAAAVLGAVTVWGG